MKSQNILATSAYIHTHTHTYRR